MHLLQGPDPEAWCIPSPSPEPGAHGPHFHPPFKGLREAREPRTAGGTGMGLCALLFVQLPKSDSLLHLNPSTRQKVSK